MNQDIFFKISNFINKEDMKDFNKDLHIFREYRDIIMKRAFVLFNKEYFEDLNQEALYLFYEDTEEESSKTTIDILAKVDPGFNIDFAKVYIDIYKYKIDYSFGKHPDLLIYFNKNYQEQLYLLNSLEYINLDQNDIETLLGYALNMVEFLERQDNKLKTLYWENKSLIDDWEITIYACERILDKVDFSKQSVYCNIDNRRLN